MGVDAQFFFRVPSQHSEKAIAWGWHIAERSGRDSWLPVGTLPVKEAPSYVEETRAGWQLFEVDCGGMRYYGPGYERGDPVFILTVADLLWHLAAKDGIDIEMFYGGDIADGLPPPLDKAAHDALYAHFLEVGHAPYRIRDDSGKLTTCPCCKAGPIGQHGWGQGLTMGGCDGCGAEYVRDRQQGAEWRRAPDRERGEEQRRYLLDSMARAIRGGSAADASAFFRALADNLADAPNVAPDVLDALKVA